MVNVPHEMVGLSIMLDYRGVGLLNDSFAYSNMAIVPRKSYGHIRGN